MAFMYASTFPMTGFSDERVEERYFRLLARDVEVGRVERIVVAPSWIEVSRRYWR